MSVAEFNAYKMAHANVIRLINQMTNVLTPLSVKIIVLNELLSKNK